jgi:hypothetical protein
MRRKNGGRGILRKKVGIFGRGSKKVRRKKMRKGKLEKGKILWC